MYNRKLSKIVALMSTSLVLAACGNDTAETEEPAVEDTTEEVETTDEAVETDTTDEDAEVADSEDGNQTFTEEELAEFNGQDGNPAYVAVDGVVYDVTDYDAWENGQHMDGVEAGTDASAAFEGSPHDTGFLSELPIVGSLQ